MKKSSQKKKKRSSRKKAQTSVKKSVVAISNGGPDKKQKDLNKKSYTAIPKKDVEKKGDKKDSFFRYLKLAGQFFREARIELKKVKWPTRKELLAATGMVIFLVIAVALFLGLIDFGLIKIIKNILG